jgi:hypothetical protein
MSLISIKKFLRLIIEKHFIVYFCIDKCVEAVFSSINYKLFYTEIGFGIFNVKFT